MAKNSFDFDEDILSSLLAVLFVFVVLNLYNVGVFYFAHWALGVQVKPSEQPDLIKPPVVVLFRRL